MDSVRIEVIFRDDGDELTIARDHPLETTLRTLVIETLTALHLAEDPARWQILFLGRNLPLALTLARLLESIGTAESLRFEIRRRLRSSYHASELPLPPKSAGSPPARSRAEGAIVERRGTVRYFSRMAPARLFPLSVILSETSLAQILKRDTSQRESEKFSVEPGSLLEIEPILPGATCYPAHAELRVIPGTAVARFSVAAHVLGPLTDSRVLIRLRGETLAEIPLDIEVRRTTLSLVAAGLGLVLPLVFAVLRAYRLDLESQIRERFSSYLQLAHLALNSLTPAAVAALFLSSSVALYFWARPRRRDTFWDISPLESTHTTAPAPVARAIPIVLPLPSRTPEPRDPDSSYQPGHLVLDRYRLEKQLSPKPGANVWLVDDEEIDALRVLKISPGSHLGDEPRRLIQKAGLFEEFLHPDFRGFTAFDSSRNLCLSSRTTSPASGSIAGFLPVSPSPGTGPSSSCARSPDHWRQFMIATWSTPISSLLMSSFLIMIEFHQI